MPNELMRLIAPSPVPHDVVLEEFSGEDAISRPFSFEVGFACLKQDLKPSDLLGKSVTVELDLGRLDEKKRYFNGVVRRFAAGDALNSGWRSYRLEIVPLFALLDEISDCRIFEQKSTLTIIETILSAANITFDSSGVTETRAKSLAREYCVQYRETTLNFLSRLMEEEGIFYFFKHEQGAHKLMLADGKSAYIACVQDKLTHSTANDKGALISRWEHGYAFFPGKWTQTDYNFETPSTNLLTSATTVVQVSGLTNYERFDYPGDYAKKGGDGDALIRRRIEMEEAQFERVQAGGEARSLFAGGTFTLENHDVAAENIAYVVTRVRHVAFDRTRSNGAGASGYSNDFEVMPAATVFRPQRLTPKPLIHGLQTAVVTGPAGEEINVDKYGRVQVLFFWDRKQSQSCWIRVAQSIAGKNWGAVYLPRIGQEVVVAFLEGDPDRPLITGSVFNAEQMPNYALPDNKTQSGFKSRSSTGGGTDDFNELRFEDKKGNEDVYFHAQKDFHRVVENDDDLKVGHDQTIEVKNNRTETVKEGNETVTVEQGNRVVTIKQGDETLTVEQGNRLVTVKTGNDTHSVDRGNRAVTVKTGDDTLDVKTGNRAVTVDTGDHKLQVKTGNQEIKIDTGNQTVTIALGNQTTKVNVGSSTTEAMQSIELKVGSNSIKIDQMGVTITGMMVKIEGQTQTQVKGLMTQINGDGMLQLKGGITMIG